MTWQIPVVCLVLAVTGLGCESPPADGRTLFLTAGCTRCHGDEGGGATQGPPIQGLRTKFSPLQLGQFLDNPLAYSEADARLKKWREVYFTPMPKLQLSAEQRSALVSYLLETHP